MIGWGVVLIWVLISALTGRALMRIIISRPVCAHHQKGWFLGSCGEMHHGHYFTRPDEMRPLGELTERPVGVATLAALGGLLWPFTLIVVCAMHAKPTSAEMKRRNGEMASEIDRLTRIVER